MFEAARLHDEVVHTSALGGFLVGAALGVALIVGVALATATCGLGVALLAGVMAGVGGMALTSLGESVGKMMSSTAGKITTGSHNIYINGENAALAEESLALCEKHPNPPPMIAEGSGKVFYNGKGAARKGDKLTCGGTIDGGSNNVFVGAESVPYLPIDDEVPQWLRTTVDVLMALAGGAASLVKMGLFASKSGLKAVTPCALKFAAGFTAGELAGRFIIGPAIGRMAGALFGNPVDAVNGRKILLEENETDFSLPGLMPLTWARFYASDLTHEGLLGRGWVLPWEQSLRQGDDQLILRDNQGRELPLPALKPGERAYLTDEQLFVVRTEGGHYLLQTLDNTFLYFGDLAEDGTPAPLRRIENALGHFIALSYDQEQTLTDISTTGGTRVHLCYDPTDKRVTRVERVVDNQPVETLVQYQYDKNGQLAEVIDRSGERSRRFAYQDGLMVSHANALGLICQYSWATLGDGVARVTEHWTSDGERYQFHYDLTNRQTLVTDVLGRKAQIHYNEGKRVVASRDFGGEEYRFDLDDAGNMTGITLPNGSQIKMEYDGFSRLTEETDPLGRSNCYSYHQNTSLVTAIDRADGSSAQWTYDNKGTLLESTDALGQTTRYLNSDDGLPHTSMDPLGNTTHLWWNELGLLEQYQDCSGQKTRYDYDERLNLVAVIDALGQTTRLIRGSMGEVQRIEYPDGHHDTYSYNALGQIISHTGGDGHTIYLERNARGLPTRRKDARGQQVHYLYDQAQRLTELVNENRQAYRFRYDASDRLIEEMRVDGLRRRFTYDVAGALTQLEEFAPQDHLSLPRVQYFEHDQAGRLLCRITDEARLDYRYDAADRIVAIERLPGSAGQALGIVPDTLAFDYDKAGRLLKEEGVLGPVGYDYDALGNLNTLTLPDGRKLNHLYYGSGHLHQVNLDGLLISDFERDALHRETLRTQGKLTSRFGYDAQGRKAWQAAIALPHEQVSQFTREAGSLLGHPEHPATAVHRSYQYSPGGELLRVADKHRGTTDYSYDASGHLRNRTPGHPQLHGEDFHYDPAGNLCGDAQWQFDKLPGNRLTAWKDLRFTYDAWGNLTEKSNSKGAYQRFQYDCENRLIKAETWNGTQLQSEAQYSYDSLGRRISKSVTRDGDIQKTDFLWQGLRLLQEHNAELSSLYVYEPGSYAPLARIDNNPEQPDQEPKRYYFHIDQIGTPQEVTDADGHIVWRAWYKAWGGLEALSPNAIDQNLRFQGQYHDRETGLHYNTFRYYDPAVGRFTTQDPIGLLGGENLYQYAPNPIGWSDPWGLTCQSNTWNQFQAAHKGQFKTRTDASVSYKELVNKQSPWPIGFNPPAATLLPGTRFKMAMSPTQASTRPGGFATFDDIPSISYVRNELAVKDAWKPTIDRVVTYEVVKPLPVNIGPVGPQVDKGLGKYLAGGGEQIEMIVPGTDRMKYLRIVDEYPIK